MSISLCAEDIIKYCVDIWVGGGVRDVFADAKYCSGEMLQFYFHQQRNKRKLLVQQICYAKL